METAQIEKLKVICTTCQYNKTFQSGVSCCSIVFGCCGCPPQEPGPNQESVDRWFLHAPGCPIKKDEECTPTEQT